VEAKGNGRVRILLADNQSLFRDAVQLVLQRQDDLEVVESVGDGMRAVLEAERKRPDVALVAADLPNCDGIRTTRLIRERVPGCRILFLGDGEDETILVEAVEAGISGYLSKDSPIEELIKAARALHRGEFLIPGVLLGRLLERLARRSHEQDEAHRAMSRLTRREREVLLLVADGGDNDGIAQALVISPETARTHIQNVLRKLGLHSRLEAAAFARRTANLVRLGVEPEDDLAEAGA